MSRSASLALAAVLGLSLTVQARAAGAAAAIPPEPGVWWDVTTEMSIRGANATPQARTQTQTQTERECLPRKIPDRPPERGECKVSDFKRSGPRLSFKMKCPQGVTGEADLLWTADTYSGTTIMRAPGFENRITTKGKKVGGDCDANEEERKEAAEREQAAEQAADAGDPQKQACAEAAEYGQVDRYLPPEPGAAAECQDPSRFCASLETRRGLTQLRQAGLDDAPQRAGKLCKKDVAAIEKRLCAALAKEPEKKVAADGEASEFLFAACPDLAKGMAKRACAGREYTAMPMAQRDFCTRWAQEALQGR
jgi:hypothetical protein